MQNIMVASTGTLNMKVRSIRFVPWSIGITLSCLALGACQVSEDSILQPKNKADAIPWFLTLNYKAVTMRVSDAVQLAATSTNVNRVPITNLPAIQWSTNDTALKVDANGRVTASGAVNKALVFAKVTDPATRITLMDTAIVTTVVTAYTFAGYRLLPAGGVGDTIIPVAVLNEFNAAVVDAAGNPVRDGAGAVIVPTTFFSTKAPNSSFQVVLTAPPRATAYNVGRFTVNAEAYLFGTLYRDSVTYRIGYPITVALNIQRAMPGTGPTPSAMSQTDITVGTGGTVRFLNQNLTLPADIKFDDLSKVVGGDIPIVKTASPGSEVVFPTAGKYTYSSSLGFRGTITVVDP